MTRVRYATTKVTHYIAATAQMLWSRLTRGVSRAFSSHAAWSARALDA